MEFFLNQKKSCKRYKIVEKHYLPEYEKSLWEGINYDSPSENYDFACLELEEKCSEVGYLGIDSSQNSSFRGQKISIVGYPDHQKIVHGKVYQTNDYLLYYEIKGKAEIGGAIITEREGKSYVIGIHKESNPEPQLNVGLRFTTKTR